MATPSATLGTAQLVLGVARAIQTRRREVPAKAAEARAVERGKARAPRPARAKEAKRVKAKPVKREKAKQASRAKAARAKAAQRKAAQRKAAQAMRAKAGKAKQVEDRAEPVVVQAAELAEPWELAARLEAVQAQAPSIARSARRLPSRARLTSSR